MSDSHQRAHHRPLQVGDAFFDSVEGGRDPALLSEAADRAATLLVRGAADSADEAVAERLVSLAEDEGLEEIAELWAGSTPDSLAGSLWRLYLLRTWVYAAPQRAARQYEAGRHTAQVARVVAGVAEPPGPDELRRMIDDVLRGIAQREYADVLLRASAFARVVATGRAGEGDEAGSAAGGSPQEDPGRLLMLAEQLEHAAHLELDRRLQ